MKTKRIGFANQKGGVGKTTTTLNVGAGLAREGKKVLLVDLDAQAHLTYGLGVDANELQVTLYDVLAGDLDVSDVILERSHDDEEVPLHLVPSSVDLSAADVDLAGAYGREMLLKEALEDVREYDYVLMDCPPNLGLLTINALVASEYLYIVAQVEYYALQGMSNLVDVISIVRDRLNEDLQVAGVIPTLFDQRKNLNNEVLERFREHFGSVVFETVIRDNVSLAEAPSYGQSIFEYDPRSYGAQDYRALTKEIIDQYE